jgi:hypothetical protein
MEKKVKIFFKINELGQQKLEKIVGLSEADKGKEVLFAIGADNIFIDNYKYKKISDFVDSRIKEKGVRRLCKGISTSTIGEVGDYRVLVYRRN